MTTVTIEHHNGIEELTEFDRIETIDSKSEIIRVWTDESASGYLDYYIGRIVDVSG